MLDEIKGQIEESIRVKRDVLQDEQILAQIERLSESCLAALRNGQQIIFAGNGGSFADAQHLAAEFVSKFQISRSALPAMALATNSSIMSAIGNDYGFDQVFARELTALGRPGDVFIPISTSGKSGNIVAAVEAANERGIASVALTGASGGTLINLCECIRVPSKATARIQECHILIGHIVCGAVESRFFP